MEILISMKAETIQKYLFMNCNIMQMPTAQANAYFVAEIREADKEKIELLKKYVAILKEELNGMDEFIIDQTTIGFKIMKKVDEDEEYMVAWDKWGRFSRNLYNELQEFFKD